MEKGSLFFCPTSHDQQFYGVTSGFTRLGLKTKHVCHGLVSPHASFHNNWITRTKILFVKFCRWGDKEKEPGQDLLSHFFTSIPPPLTFAFQF